MPWRRLAALITLTNAQLVVDWTAKSTFENGAPLKARCALYTTVTFHRTCLPNGNSTPSSRHGYGDNVASMAWGA